MRLGKPWPSWYKTTVRIWWIFGLPIIFIIIVLLAYSVAVSDENHGLENTMLVVI